jgi:N-acetylglucosaminyl-diphospho-decaprenol L-rhamnosyltransferase
VTSIVTVNFRTPELVIESIRSVAAHGAVLNGGKLVVVDNHSGDGSAEKIQSAIVSQGWQSWVKLLRAERNGGFAYGNNVGIKHLLSISPQDDYLMILNPDTLVRGNAIGELIRFLDAYPKVGVVGSRLENANGSIECSAHQFPSPLGELLDGARLGLLSKWLARYEVTPALRHDAYQCDWVSGSSMMVRRQTLEEVGFLDEAFFLYFEEVDFFQRIAKTPWQVWYLPQSVVMHIEGVATGIKVAKRRPSYWFDSRRRYFVKHYGVTGLFAADFLWSIGRFSYKVRRLLGLGAKNTSIDPPKLTWDILTGDFLAILSGQVCKIKQGGRGG